MSNKEASTRDMNAPPHSSRVLRLLRVREVNHAAISLCSNEMRHLKMALERRSILPKCFRLIIEN